MFEEEIETYKNEIDELAINPRFKQITDVMDFRRCLWRTNKDSPDNYKEDLVSLFEKNFLVAFYNEKDNIFEIKLNFYNPVLLDFLETPEFKTIFATFLDVFKGLGDN